MGLREPMRPLKWYGERFIAGMGWGGLGCGRAGFCPLLWGQCFSGNHGSQEPLRVVLFPTVLRTSVLMAVEEKIGFT